MKDRKKTKAQLLEEMAELRREVTRLKLIEAQCLEIQAGAEQNATADVEDAGSQAANTFTGQPRTNRQLNLADTEANLEEISNYLDSVIESLPTMLFLKDAEELRFVRWNKAAEELIGFKRQDMIGKNDYDLFPEEEADFFVAKDREVLLKGEVLDIPEEPIQTADKGVRWLHTRKVPIYGTDGQAKYLLGISEDITERKRTADDLADERSLLRTLVDNLPDFIYAKDRNGRYLLNNFAHAQLMGVNSPDELRGNSDADFYPQELAEQYYADELAIMESGQSIIDFEEPNLDHKTGDKTWTSTTKVPLKDGYGQVVGLVGISRDITESKLTQKMLTKRAAELEAVAQVSIAASTILDVDELVQEVADLTKARFGLYHAHIYRLDHSQNTLNLAAGAGPVGRQMVETGWSIPADSEQSLVARAARTRKGVIANDVRNEADWLPNPLLPSTRSEMAVPMIVGDQVLGVLDVQADVPDYFTGEDLRIKTTLGAQVAVALDNARLFQEEHRALAQLEETTGFLDSIVENIPNMIFVKDAEELRFVRFNRAGEELIGVSREEMIGKNDYDFFPKEEADFFVTKDREVLVSGQLVDIQEETIQTVRQGTRYLHTTKVPVYGTDGRPRFLLGISEDITERKRAEAERELLLDEVQVAYRQYIRREWDQLLREHAQGSWHVEHQQPGFQMETNDEALAEVRKSVMLEGETRIDAIDQDNGHGSPGTVVAPISLRGEILGTLSLQDIDPDRLWTDDEIALIETVSEQLALTLENLRLFEDTQQLATREKVIADVTQQVWASGELEQVMQIAVEQLGAKLDASKVVIRLGTEDQLLADDSSDSGGPQ